MAPWQSNGGGGGGAADSAGGWAQSTDGRWFWAYAAPPATQQHQQPAPQANQQTEWPCNACGTKNWTPKTKCSCCGIKKSWAAVVSQGQKPIPPPVRQSGHVPEQVQQASDMAQQANTMQPVTSWTHPNAPSTPQRRTVTIEESPRSSTVPTQTRATIKNQIKIVEASLQCLPEDDSFSELRASLLTKIESLKQDLSDSAPIGARIDGTRGLLMRCQKRREAALATLRESQEAASFAEAEVSRVEKELEELEAALAKAPPPAPGSGESHLDIVSSQVNMLMSELAAAEGLEPEHLMNAKMFAHQFIAGMKRTIEHVEAAKSEEDAVTRRRLTGKQSTAEEEARTPPSPAPLLRNYHKQPARRSVTDFFLESRHPRSRERSRTPGAGARPRRPRSAER